MGWFGKDVGHPLSGDFVEKIGWMFGLWILCMEPLVVLYNTITLKGFYLDRCFFCHSYSEYSETIVLRTQMKDCEDSISQSRC